MLDACVRDIQKSTSSSVDRILKGIQHEKVLLTLLQPISTGTEEIERRQRYKNLEDTYPLIYFLKLISMVSYVFFPFHLPKIRVVAVALSLRRILLVRIIFFNGSLEGRGR